MSRSELLEHVDEKLTEAYTAGFKAGLELYAVWRDGEQWIDNGCSVLRLRVAQARVDTEYNFQPPSADVEELFTALDTPEETDAGS